MLAGIHMSALLDFPETEFHLLRYWSLQSRRFVRKDSGFIEVKNMAEWVDNSETPEYKSGVIPIYRPAGRTRGR